MHNSLSKFFSFICVIEFIFYSFLNIVFIQLKNKPVI